MTVNAPLLVKTLDHIRENPTEWYQADWAIQWNDGRVTACFAGLAVRLAGYDFDFGKYLWSIATDAVTTGVHIAEAARVELGLTGVQALELFEANNTFEDLERIVNEILKSEYAIAA